MCVKEAIQEGSPILLEPIMKLEIISPQEFTGDIIGDLNGYHGRGTEVLTPSGEWTYVCNAVLVSGDGVDKTQQDLGECTSTIGSGWGDFLQTPGGHALAHCHN